MVHEGFGVVLGVVEMVYGVLVMVFEILVVFHWGFVWLFGVRKVVYGGVSWSSGVVIGN